MMKNNLNLYFNIPYAPRELNCKKGVSVEEGRRNRQDAALHIRKNIRQESLAKR